MTKNAPKRGRAITVSTGVIFALGATTALAAAAFGTLDATDPRAGRPAASGDSTATLQSIELVRYRPKTKNGQWVPDPKLWPKPDSAPDYIKKWVEDRDEPAKEPEKSKRSGKSKDPAAERPAPPKERPSVNDKADRTDKAGKHFGPWHRDGAVVWHPVGRPNPEQQAWLDEYRRTKRPDPPEAGDWDEVADAKPIKWGKAGPMENGKKIRITWTSGPEPCYVLDRVEIVEREGSVELTVFEGRAAGSKRPICPAVTQEKDTEVDLDEPLGNRKIVDGAS